MAEHFINKGGNNKTSSLSIVPDWEKIHLEEISNSDEFITVIPATVNNNRGSSRILMLKINEVVQAVVFTKYPKNNQNGKFSGNLGISTLDGKFLYGYKVRNGTLVSKYIPKIKTALSLKQSEPCADYVQGEDWNCGELEEVIIDSKADDEEIPIIYIYPPSGSDPLDGGTDSGWGYTNGGSKSGENGTDEDGEILPEEPRPVKIDTDSLNNDCVKGIIEKLKLKDTHYSTVPDLGTEVSHLSEVILNLFDYSSSAHLEFLINDLDNANAETEAKFFRDPDNSPNMKYTITLDKDYVDNATQLAIARTIIHETVHAWLSEIFNETEPSPLKDLLVDYYTLHGDHNTAQHEAMSDFTQALGSSLAAWDDHKLPEPSDEEDMSYYDALAWSGEILESEAYNLLCQDEKDLIDLANENEGDANNTSNEKAKGIKCP